MHGELGGSAVPSAAGDSLAASIAPPKSLGHRHSAIRQWTSCRYLEMELHGTERRGKMNVGCFQQDGGPYREAYCSHVSSRAAAWRKRIRDGARPERGHDAGSPTTAQSSVSPVSRVESPVLSSGSLFAEAGLASDWIAFSAPIFYGARPSSLWSKHILEHSDSPTIEQGLNQQGHVCNGTWPSTMWFNRVVM